MHYFAFIEPLNVELGHIVTTLYTTKNKTGENRIKKENRRKDKPNYAQLLLDSRVTNTVIACMITNVHHLEGRYCRKMGLLST